MTADQEYWPSINAQNKPWTRWWWLGSAVDKANITRLLEEYSRVGLGGVEITSLYGVQGEEERNIEYLSDEWLAMLRHTIAEAKRLNMQVDLPPGSGWRIGGPYIDESLACSKLKLEEDGTSFTAEIVPGPGSVKRAGPGGQGRSFNPFYRESLQAVQDYFTEAFSGLGIRAMFHDSWEYDVDACPDLFEQFKKLRGYDLSERLGDLWGDTSAERYERVQYDLKLTLADLGLESFIKPWHAWCHQLNMQSRNQAHGTPGNWLDFYGAVDIPETEGFRNITPDTILLSKFASSAAHVTNKQLASSETGTWLKEHFNTTLADMKHLIDTLFLAGINHHVFHGTVYSPDDALWPGWLFYASTQLNPNNSIWHDIDQLNSYIARCQSVLQAGSPDENLLVYFPFHDVMHDPDLRPGQWISIEGAWLRKLKILPLFHELHDVGYGFDYISDRQILQTQAADSLLKTEGGQYRALLVPPVQYLPTDTIKALLDLQHAGAEIIFMDLADCDIPGLADLENQRAVLKELLDEITFQADWKKALAKAGINPESMANVGLQYIRRKLDNGYFYYIVNQSEADIDQSIALTVPFETALIMDPHSGIIGTAETAEPNQLRIQLEAGESIIVRTSEAAVECEPWLYINPADETMQLEGPWSVEFIKGGPELPEAVTMDQLISWDQLHAEVECFAGTARYSMKFDVPDADSPWELDLGVVHSSARIRLNGKEEAVLIGPNYSTVLTNLQTGENLLEIEVTSLAANRIRYLDRTGVQWKIFEDINFVSREYCAFDASDWNIMPTGLLGPVRLNKLKAVRNSR